MVVLCCVVSDGQRPDQLADRYRNKAIRKVMKQTMSKFPDANGQNTTSCSKRKQCSLKPKRKENRNLPTENHFRAGYSRNEKQHDRIPLNHNRKTMHSNKEYRVQSRNHGYGDYSAPGNHQKTSRPKRGSQIL